MWTLWIFGDNVEDRMGSLRFAIFYLLCGSIAGITHMLINPDSTVPSVGASGAIAGVLGAYLIFFPTARLVVMFPIFFFPFFFEVPAVLYLVLWFLINLFSGTAALAGPEQVGGIAFWAHIGGFVSGMLLCGLFAPRRRHFQSDEYGLEWAWEQRPR
jgi:membrane associated rhomboid family serine protease